MRLRHILIHSIIGNFSTFKGYYIATSFSSMVFFMASMLTQHPDMPLEEMRLGFQKAISAVTIIEFIFLSLFIVYSAMTYMKQRSRDYAMYKILGMKHYQLRALCIGENIIIYLAGIITGILVGMLFSKFLFMIIAHLFELPSISLYFPLQSIGKTFVWFGGLSLLLNLCTGLLLQRVSVKSIMQWGRKTQKKPRNYPILALLSVLLLAIGYGFAYTAETNNILNRVLPVTGVVIVATYIFYHQFCAFALRRLTHHKRFYYRGINTLWISDLSYRIKDFTLVLFLTTIIMSVGFVILSSVYSVSYNIKQLGNDKYNFSEMIIAPSAITSKYTDSIQHIFKVNQVEYTQQNYRLKVENKKEKQELYLSKSSIHHIATLLLSGKEMPKDSVSTHQMLSQFFYWVAPKSIHLVDDETFESLNDSLSTYRLQFFDRENRSIARKEFYELTRTFYADKNRTNGLFISTGAAEYTSLFGLRFVLLISLSFAGIFFISAGSMLYFKFFNHLQQEKEKYNNFRKMGLSIKEVILSSRIQMMILFFLPNILAITHSSFAIKALSSTSSDKFNFTLPVVQVIGVILLLQVIFFFIFNRQYNLNLLQSIERKTHQ